MREMLSHKKTVMQIENNESHFLESGEWKEGERVKSFSL